MRHRVSPCRVAWWYQFSKYALKGILPTTLPDLLARCDRALATLRRSRQSTGVQRRPSVRQELLSTVRGGAKGIRKKHKRTSAWRHKFVCLARQGQNHPPLCEADKDELFAASLGEKEIDLDASSEEFQEILLQAFPQLGEGGGYQFLKCLPNSRLLEPLSGLVMTSPAMLKQRVGTARTYIRPLQRDLDTTPTRSMPDTVG